MKMPLAWSCCLLLVACAAPPSGPSTSRSAGSAGEAAAMPASSAECLAAKLAPAEPFTASAIPSEVLQKRQNGWVAVRYDVVAGKAENVAVAASKPEGLYDRYALQHTLRYRDAGGKTVRGCVMTIDVKF
jgi:hypothetical protein